jgi:iron complex outermembrane recepter protein
MISTPKKLLATTIGISLFLPLGLAHAALEEIIVTAQKRDESVQDVPIAITAFGAEELEKSVFKSNEDIGMVTPGLQMGRQVGAPVPYMRGVGAQATSVGVEPATSLYLDGVYLSGNTSGVMTLNNVERIEVLKGPQGTLFGRNTTGGVVHIITKDPTYDTQVKVGATYGSHDISGGSFYGSTGLSDTVAADFSVQARRQGEGWGINRANGDEVGFEEYTSVRTKLLWEPSDDTTVKLLASYNENDDDIGVIRSCINDEFGCLAFSPISNIRDVDADWSSFTEREMSLVSARIEHSFDSIDIVSITSYRDAENTQIFDFDASPARIARAETSQNNETFTQEIQILSTDEDKIYSWIAGFYYYDDDWSYPPLEVQQYGPGISANAYSNVLTESYSFFGEITFELGESTDFIAGLRWTHDEKELNGSTVIEAPIGNPIMQLPFLKDDTWAEYSYRAVLNHHFTEDVMAYISYNRGFKSGAFDSVVFNGQAPDPVNPEILDAYEIGMKGEFYDGALRLNLAAFYYDYKDVQLQKVEGSEGGTPNSILLNAAESEIMGVEVDGHAAITDNLTARFGVSLLDTEYSDFQGCVINTPASAPGVGGINIRTVGDCSGNDMVRSPELTYNISLNYELPTDSGTYLANIMAAYTDDYAWEPDNNIIEDDYTVINASVGWMTVDEKLKLTLWGRNITNEEYSVYTTSAGSGTVAAGAPEVTWGLTVDYYVF